MTIQTKFDPGQEVWFMQDNRAVEKTVKTISLNISLNDFRCPEVKTLYLLNDGHWRSEDLLFPSKDELLKSL